MPNDLLSPQALRSELWDLKRIAHAGGGFHNKIYNNSEEAILYNLDKGFEWFEIDFHWIDGVLMSDGDRAATTHSTTASYYDAKDEGKAQKSEGVKTSMSIEQLAALMVSRPEIVIVPDVKDQGRNVEALRIMSEHIPDFEKRVLAQIFQPEEYAPVRELGFPVIWTLYNYKGGDSDVLRIIDDMQLVAVTMPIARAEAGLAHRVAEHGHQTLAHTINDPAQLESLQALWGVGEVYSDFVAPGISRPALL